MYIFLFSPSLRYIFVVLSIVGTFSFSLVFCFAADVADALAALLVPCNQSKCGAQHMRGTRQRSLHGRGHCQVAASSLASTTAAKSMTNEMFKLRLKQQKPKQNQKRTRKDTKRRRKTNRSEENTILKYPVKSKMGQR